MARRGLVAVVSTAALLLVVVAGAYAWDSAKADQIAEGVRAGELELGGLTEAEAQLALRRELLAPLERPLHVIVGEEHFKLPGEKLEVRANIDSVVAEAIEVSRDGGLIDRVWRYATGGEVEHVIDPRIHHSRAAVEEFVAEIAAAVNRDAVNATVLPTATSLEPVQSRAGVAVREQELLDELLSVLDGDRGSRTIEARTLRVEPEVTTDELAASYPTYITIVRDAFELRLYRDLKLAKTYTIAVGAQGYQTPAGLFALESKQVNPTWYVPDAEWAGELAGQVIPPGPDNPLQARWMGFAGAAGIHGTNDPGSLGSAASHGCIRMAVPDVKELYGRVSIGTPVYVE